MKNILFSYLALIFSVEAEVLVSDDWVKEQVRPALDEYVTWGDYDISFTGHSQWGALNVNSLTEVETQVLKKSYNPSNQGFFILLNLKTLQGKSLANFSLRGRVIAMADIPVLTRPIGPGEVIKLQDITHVRIPVSRITTSVVRDQGHLVGHQGRYHLLQPGKPVLKKDVTLPVMVSKGSLATVIYKTGTMTLTARAVAQQDGARGETIKFVRPDTKTFNNQKIQPIFAKVVSEGVAEIIPVGQLNYEFR